MTPEAFQHTLGTSVSCDGVGLHGGEAVRLTLRPAAAGAGVVFVRTDVRDRDNRVPVSAEAVFRTVLHTEIRNAAGVTVSTIEHLMAAFAALGVDNAVVELDRPELPIMDGSAADFVALVDRAGLRRQGAPRRYLEMVHRVEVRDGAKLAALEPSPLLEIDFLIDFDAACIGRQRVALAVDAASFRRELADCRTFGFAADVHALRAMGLARGGGMHNAVVVDDGRVLNPEGLRRPDEFVRHKALDAVGDLYVLGMPVLGRFEARLAGHAVNNLLARAVAARPSAWRVRTFAPELAEAV